MAISKHSGDTATFKPLLNTESDFFKSMSAQVKKYYTRQINGGINTCIQGNVATTAKLPWAGCVVPNCVGWCEGRLLQILNEAYASQGGTNNPFKYLNCNAGPQYISQAKKLGFGISQTPVLGGVMVWDETSNGACDYHVTIVEKIISNSEIKISESHWNGSKSTDARWGALYDIWTVKKSENWGHSGKFLGCVNVFSGLSESGNDDWIESWQIAAKNDGLYTGTIDGIGGSYMNTAISRASLKSGSTHKNLVNWLQNYLYSLGYYKGTINDGSYGSFLEKAVREWQTAMKKYDLYTGTVDGWVGTYFWTVALGFYKPIRSWQICARNDGIYTGTIDGITGSYMNTAINKANLKSGSSYKNLTNWLEYYLHGLGYYTGTLGDNMYGSYLVNAVKKWQTRYKKYGIYKGTVDGWVGSYGWKAILGL